MSVILRPDEERGAILPLFALMIVVFLAFAAMAVDLGMAWAERRQSQNVVDAAVMAGALEYLEDDAPSSADVVAIVRDYVDRNTDTPVALAEWLACSDPDAVADGFSQMTDADGNTMPCITLKQGSTGADETLLRVKLPDRVIDTAFARVVGLDTIAVNAFAIAEIRYNDLAAILPFSLPSNASGEECMGTPPSGQLKAGELDACTGPNSGNFGLLDSPFFEQHTIDGSDLDGCPSDPNFATRTPFNLAAGIDHSIQEWPGDVGSIPSGDLGPKPAGGDTCDADTDPDPEVPYVLLTQTGYQHNEMNAGLIGPGIYDDGPSRLRRIGGLNTGTGDDQLAFATQSNANWAALDNVGLWEYLEPVSGAGVPAECSDTFAAYAGGGRAASDAIEVCLDTAVRGDEINHPNFDLDIIYSPRFALVPALSYVRGEKLTGTEWRAVVELKPVYLHSTWYDCAGKGKTYDRYCIFQPSDTPGVGTVLFNPGEGTAPPVVEDNKGSLGNPKSIKLEGLTAFVLEWEWLPAEAQNQLGENVPLEVYLYR